MEVKREKTLRERNIASYRLDEMQAAFEEAKKAGKWDKKRECYTDFKGNPIVESRSVDFKALLEVIPTSEELYSKKFLDNTYIPNMEQRIREVMLASLKKKEEEKLKKNVKKMVEELKKTAEETIDENQ
ncbi:hypothetical protein Hanom_Chr05g00398221 [Helianthus anomalus]